MSKAETILQKAYERIKARQSSLPEDVDPFLLEAMKEIASIAWDGAVKRMHQSLKITQEEGSFTIPGTPTKQQFIDNLFNNEVD